jgi:hypothetical protein
MTTVVKSEMIGCPRRWRSLTHLEKVRAEGHVVEVK